MASARGRSSLKRTIVPVSRQRMLRKLIRVIVMLRNKKSIPAINWPPKVQLAP